ncbi:hypothetical protein [Radiobacillus deserti]|uniref:DUF3951 domain-containing protein n=1 Tax=Radiobacillus deserti TaxID=2594883 RepID=A0A516KI91_9BACI|nr:hypothetical protein [Radiobacillus deserti]QDP41113.1 hypothetical protein FN924_13480 [Radiobacillus deserti]
MIYIYLLVVALVVYIGFRIVKKKSLPSNEYTPYDNIVMGRKENIRPELIPYEDTKHVIRYEEDTDWNM